MEFDYIFSIHCHNVVLLLYDTSFLFFVGNLWELTQVRLLVTN